MKRRDHAASRQGLARLPLATPIFLLSLAVASGCTDSSPAPTDSKSEASVDSQATTDDGRLDGDSADSTPAVLQGRVLFQGAMPKPRKIIATKDVEYCGKFDGLRPEVVVSDSSGLSGAVIEVRGIEEPAGGWQWKHPQDGYVLRQKGCAFEPPLLVVPDGAELRVFNDDPLSHNVNTGLWNILQAAGETEPLVRPITGLRPIRVGCNIHSWMESWIYFAQSPYYTVTNQDGDFRIEGVPPGKYRVVAWHPSLRFKRAAVTLPAGEIVDEKIVFQSPF